MKERKFDVSIWTKEGMQVPKVFLDQQGGCLEVYRLEMIDGCEAVYVSTGKMIRSKAELESMARQMNRG